MSAHNEKELVLFDIDGTLLDTLPDLLSLTNRIMKEMGFPLHTLASLKPLMGMDPKYRLIHLALPESANDREREQALNLWEAYFPEHQDEARPFPKVSEALDDLASANIIMGIVSNKRQDAIEELARKWFPQIEGAIVGRQDGVPVKPAPDMLEMALARMKIRTSCASYVGDTASDMIAAHQAGMRAIACAWGFQDPSTFDGDTKPSVIIETPAELSSLFLR